MPMHQGAFGVVCTIDGQRQLLLTTIRSTYIAAVIALADLRSRFSEIKDARVVALTIMSEEY